MTASTTWDAYERIQSELSRNRFVDDKAWGREAELTYLLDRVATNEHPDLTDLKKARESASRLERSRSQARKTKLTAVNEVVVDIYRAVEANIELDRVRQAVNPEDWGLLLKKASGWTYKEISQGGDTTAVALRVRVTRIRAALVSQSGKLVPDHLQIPA